MANLWTAPRGAPELVGLQDLFRRGGDAAFCLPRSVTGATTLLSTDRLLLVDTTTGAFTVTLPAASGMPTRPYAVKLIAGANNVTLARSGSDEIWTTTNVTSVVWNTTGVTKIVWPCLVTAPGTWGWVEINT